MSLSTVAVLPETQDVIVDIFLADICRRLGAACRIAEEQTQLKGVRLRPAVNVENMPGHLSGRCRDKILLV